MLAEERAAETENTKHLSTPRSSRLKAGGSAFKIQGQRSAIQHPQLGVKEPDRYNISPDSLGTLYDLDVKLKDIITTSRQALVGCAHAKNFGELIQAGDCDSLKNLPTEGGLVSLPKPFANDCVAAQARQRLDPALSTPKPHIVKSADINGQAVKYAFPTSVAKVSPLAVCGQ